MPAENHIRIVPSEELPPAPPELATSNLKPVTFTLEQNYPNPFNPSTVIRYSLPVNSYVTLKVYNMLGEEVARLIDGIEDAGYKSVEFDASKFPSGIYAYRLSAGTFVDVKKLLLLK